MTINPDTSDEILVTLAPSTFRFWCAVVIIFAFGAFLLWIAATGAAASTLATVVLVLMSGLSFFAANRIHKTQRQSIYLTSEGLFDTTGRTLCTTEQMASLDRSFFAFKPSNGFVIRLKEPMDRAWVPGLWWRYGKRLGVGGITSVAQAKFMADTIALLLASNPEVLDADHKPLAR